MLQPGDRVRAVDLVAGEARGTVLGDAELVEGVDSDLFVAVLWDGERRPVAVRRIVLARYRSLASCDVKPSLTKLLALYA